MRIYTLGYQGLSLDAYVELLRASGIGVVLDVRERAWSQRPDFVKSNMQSGLEYAGIDYIHVPSAGNPSSIRKTVRTPEECLERYRLHISANPSCIGELYSFARLAFERGRPACLTCFERLPEHCHRSVLVEALAATEPPLEVVHLPLPPPAEKRQHNSLFPKMGTLLKTSFVHPKFCRLYE